MQATDREIFRLAWPAFLALVAEPLFLLGDAIIVGHLGTTPLAALGVAGAVLQTAVGLCVFLAYGTTGAVARKAGAGDTRGALADGIDGLWLAAFIGLGATVVMVAAAPLLVTAFGAEPAVSASATTYLRIAALGTTPLLLMLAATGVLRGLLDTRTPLIVAVLGNLANLILNALLVYGAGLGLAGSAIGSVLAQVGCALALGYVVIRGARREGVSLRPTTGGVRRAGRAGVPLLIRTLTLRAALLLTLAVAIEASDTAGLAAHQLAITLWAFLAFVLDAIAIAAQALTGRSLGAGDRETTRTLTTRMIWWGLWSGVVTGVGLAAASPFLGPVFSGDSAVHRALVPLLLVGALCQPIAGVVFVLDGVLIGAGDGGYLAWAGLIALLAYVPFALLAGQHSLVAVWWAFAGVFMAARGATLLHRARGDNWLVLGNT